jgi:hypothetical protein
LKGFPKTDTKLHTEKGIAICQKVDIFKGLMWFAYKGDWANWHVLTTEQVKEIKQMNSKKEPVAALEDFIDESPSHEKSTFENVVGQDSLTRFDRPKKSKSKRKKPRNRRKTPNNQKPTKS